MRHHVLQAVKTLEGWFDPEVIDLISLKPLDFETIGASVRKLIVIVEVHENWGLEQIDCLN